MSYILDALKKAERERDIAQIPTLMTVHDTRDERPRGRNWTAIIACLTCVALLVWIVASLRKPDVGQIPSQVDGNKDRQSRQLSSPSVIETPITSPMPAVTPANASRPRTPVESSKARLAAIPDLPAKKPAAEGIGMSASKQSQKPEASPPEAKIPMQPSQVSQAPTQNTMKGTPPSEGAQSAPASLREAMAKMTMTILLYSEVNSERMAFINDRKYVEGEYVDGRYLLESITPEGAWLSYQGERALLRSRAR
jgi:general secretion pathway protein B